MLTLSNAKREWIRLVESAIRANPFSEKRRELDRIIGGTDEDALASTLRTVEEEVDRLIAQGKGRWDLYAEPDATLMKRFFLFDFFHRFICEFDAHIEAQILAGERPLKLHFAREGLGYLQARGFSEAEAAIQFATCFQLRRAFYFINRSLVGQSPCMGRLREKLWNNVFTNNIERYDRFLRNRMEDFSTLIIGETGAGKGAAAAAIGRSGFIPFDPAAERFALSFTAAFVPVNLAEFSESLIEAELFGFVKGAFTGAVRDQEGVFSGCSPYGSIFLDEIGEVSPTLQVKLLKVLEERIFSPVGSRERIRFAGRIIAATHRKPEEMLQTGAMRPDFYYRLCSDTLVVPPLRMRIAETPEELRDMVAHILGQLVEDEASGMRDWVVEILIKELGSGYPWPGNVRELGQMIRRILLNQSCRDGLIRETRPDVPEFTAKIAEGVLSMQELTVLYCKHLHGLFGTYGEVARRTGLDRRTVKKYVETP